MIALLKDGLLMADTKTDHADDSRCFSSGAFIKAPTESNDLQPHQLNTNSDVMACVSISGQHPSALPEHVTIQRYWRNSAAGQSKICSRIM